MEGILLTAGAILLIVAGVWSLIHWWPKSYTRSGYHLEHTEEGDRGATLPDDERPWHFDDRGGNSSKA